jgi:hypothetical protein
MGTKKPIYHFLIRIGILILLLIAFFIKVNFDEIAFFLSQAYCLFLLLEMTYFFVKKNKKLALINLALLITIEILPILILIRLMV